MFDSEGNIVRFTALHLSDRFKLLLTLQVVILHTKHEDFIKCDVLVQITKSALVCIIQAPARQHMYCSYFMLLELCFKK